MSAPSSLGEGRRQSRKARPRWLTTRLGLVLVLCASLAQAQASNAQLAIGRDLAVEARVLMDASKWEEATTKLNRVLRIKETPGVRFLLGYCYENRGLLVEAGLEYARARRMLDAGAEAPDVVAFLTDAEKRLPELTPTLVMQVQNPGVRWRLSVGTKVHEAAELGQPLSLNPGTYQLVVTAPGYAPWELTLHLEQKDRRRFVATLEPLPPAPAPAPTAAESGVVASPARSATDASGETTWRPVVLVSVGGGGAVVAAVAFGIGFAVAQGNASSNAERSIRELGDQLGREPTDASCNTSSPDIAQSCGNLVRGRTDEVFYGNGAIASFVTAGALAVLTAGAIWWMWPGAEERHYSIAPTPSGDGAVVSSRWRF